MSGHPYRRRGTQAVGLLRLIVAAALIVGGTAGNGAAQQGESVFAVARAAIRSGQVAKTRTLGFHNNQRRFAELPPEGALLIGFDIGVGRFFNTEVVYALRPVYLTAAGETYYKDYGLFADRADGKRIFKSRVLRMERLRAQPGYAVGGMTLRTGLLVDGLAVTFMRVHGRALDPREAYTSSWVGNRTGGSEHSITGGGGPVIGVFGSQEEDHVKSLGLYFLQSAAPAPAAAPQPVAPTHLLQPPIPQKDVPPVPALNEAPPQAEPPADEPAVAVEPAKKVKPRKTSAGVMSWLPLAAFGLAAVPVLFLLVALRRRSADKGNHQAPETPGEDTHQITPDSLATAVQAGRPPVAPAAAREHLRPGPPPAPEPRTRRTSE